MKSPSEASTNESKEELKNESNDENKVNTNDRKRKKFLLPEEDKVRYNRNSNNTIK